MNKKLIALAVAGALAAPLAAQAEATLYGKAHVSVDMMDGADNEPDYAVRSRASRVGVKGAEDLGGGLKAVYQFEWQVDMADDGGTGNLKSRNQIVGLAGGFGTVALGRHDTPVKMSTGKLDIFSDTAGDYNVVLKDDQRLGNVIAYLSPSMGGFHVNAALVSGDEVGTDDSPVAYSVAATYANGPLYAAVAHEATNMDGPDYEQTRVGAGYAFGDLSVGLVWADVDNSLKELLKGNEYDYDAWVVNGAYAMGNNTVKAAFGQIDPDGGNERQQWVLGVDHKFSKSTKVYALYTDVDEGGSAHDVDISAHPTDGMSGLSVGLVKKF